VNLSLAQEPRLAHLPQGTPPQSRSLASTLKLHRLRTPEEIATVLHLRGEIDLSVHAAAGRDFVSLEKKETKWASCSGSNTGVS
jgi:hypothetical protein